MKAAFFGVVLLAANSGWAFETGREFLKECEPSTKQVFTQLSPDDQLLGIGCGGYLRGFMAAIRITEAGQGKRMICSPAGAEIRQALRIVVGWMNGHTPQLDQPAPSLIFASLSEAFPCGGKPVPPPSGDSAPLSL